MLFGDVAREYRNLKAQLNAGQLSEADMRARLEEMMIEDAEGKWWSIGFETGKWYYHDGQQWVRGEPPADKPAPPPVTVIPIATPDAVSATVEPPGSVTGAATAGILGGSAPSAPSTAPRAAASGAAAVDAAGAKPQGGRPKSVVAAAVSALLVLILAIGAFAILRNRPAAETTGPGSGQNGSAATVMSPGSLTATAAVVAVLSSPTPTRTPAPTSVPPTDTATLQPTAEPSPAPTATLPPPTATSTPKPPTAPPTATATPRRLTIPPGVLPTLQPAITLIPAVPGLVTGFEQFGTWVRGNQPHGTFTRSTEQAHSGAASARLDYNFPAVRDNFVVFSARPPLSIPGTPTALSVWVLGDGSGHFLNAWVQDSQGEVRSFHFGPVPAGRGWQQLTARLDTTAPWPQGHISGPDNGKLDYPLRLHSIVLDSPGEDVSKGTIYLDDIMVARG